MKVRFIGLVAAIVTSLLGASVARAATIYSSLKDLGIPADFDGMYLDLDTGATSVSAFTGWDINPFFGGTGIGNSAAFQPARVGTSNLDAVLNLAVGTLLAGSFTFASGVGGSGNSGHEHIGSNAGQFQVGVEGYLGFKLTRNDGSGPLNGWMRVTLTNNTGGATIKDWAYDDAGGTIVIGRVIQGGISGNAQVVTLSPGPGESFALGSAITDTGGNTNSLLKTGGGTTTLAAANTFTGQTTISSGTLLAGGVNALKNTSRVVISGGTFRLGASDVVSNSADVTLSGGTFDTGGFSEGNAATVGLGSLNLFADSILDFGLGTGSQLLFASVGSHSGGRLTISNWSGTSGQAGGPANDRLMFNGVGSDFTSRYLQTAVSFNGVNGYVAIPINPTLFEIVAIPEPAAPAFVGLGLLVLLGFRPARQRGTLTQTHTSTNHQA